MYKKIFVFSLLLSLFVLPLDAFAAKSPRPRITEVVGINTPNIRIHFQLNPIKAGQIIKVRYRLKTRKFNDVKYKIPKKAKRTGIVNAAASSTGSAIDLSNLPLNLEKFIYEARVRVKVPKKSWSAWSNGFSF
jgi:hypothetical protein